MYINSNMTDGELVRCTFGTTNPLLRILAERLTERNRQIDDWQAWYDCLVKAFDSMGTVIDEQPTD